MAYFLGGFTWEGDSQLDRFLEDNIWQSGWGDGKYQETFNTIKIGDYFALKSTYRQNGKSWLRIYNIGIVTNILDEKTLEIEWDKNFEYINHTDISWYAHTLLQVEIDEHINKIFGKITENKKMKNLINLLESKYQIILQGAPGTGKTYTAKDIAEQMIFDTVSSNKKEQAEKLKNSDQFKLVQFHPSYTYEDFVRGIVVSTENSSTPEYKTINKVLGKFAKEAYENWILFKLSEDKRKKALAEKSKIEQFINNIQEEIDSNGKYQLTNNVYLFEYDDFRFKYKGDNWKAHPEGLNMKYSELVKILEKEIIERKEIKQLKNINSLTNSHATYYAIIAKNYSEFSPSENNILEEVTTLQKYILIIDEINRANLPAVLGELIYALEYRGDVVDSMYKLDDEDNSLILPPNLYLIGTMNTADRSVGQIDYAIRRRFAFVDMEAKDLKEFQLPEGCTFQSDLFQKVSKLFRELENGNTNKYLSQEFEAKDVQLGHSYFITNDKNPLEMRLEYEIKPILREYVRDGILKDNAKEFIEAL